MAEEKSVMLEVFEKLGSLDAKLDNINQLRNTAQRAETKADLAQDIAEEARASTKSAHHRIDRHDKIIFWAGTSIIGSVIVAIMAIVLGQ